MVAEDEPRTVVGHEHHKRVVFQAVFFQRRENLAGAPIHFCDGVPVESALGRAAEFFTHRERHVGHRVRDVEEKRPLVIALV